MEIFSKKCLGFFAFIFILLAKTSADSSSYSQALASAQSSSYSSSGCHCNSPICNCHPPKCPDVCPAIYAPVCVSHGTCYQTYENICIVDKANCEAPPGSPKLWIVAIGKCEDYPIVSDNLCGCDFACPMHVDPVCGFNGVCYKTFSNGCIMANYNCWHPYDTYVYQHDNDCYAYEEPVCF